jgi:hypothetical protein
MKGAKNVILLLTSEKRKREITMEYQPIRKPRMKLV